MSRVNPAVGGGVNDTKLASTTGYGAAPRNSAWRIAGRDACPRPPNSVPLRRRPRPLTASLDFAGAPVRTRIFSRQNQAHHLRQLSLVPAKESKSHRLTLAEQMTFESLTSFLYMDRYKGMAAGNLPRRCAHCRRWFLAVGGYDTRYCDRVVPGTGGKTCRKVGAHEREKEKQKTETASREYSRIYNRLKARKRRGRITTDEWNRQVVQAQELKDAFLAKQITRQEYVRKLDEL